MDIYDKYANNWDSRYRIGKVTWELLQYGVEKYNVKTCVEFGCGLSTFLLDLIGVKVTAFEDEIEYVHPILNILRQSVVVVYDDVLELKIESHYDMAFIDGPRVMLSREPAFWLVSKTSTPLVLCHDVWRKWEKIACMRYFAGWEIIGTVRENKGEGKTRSVLIRLGDKK